MSLNLAALEEAFAPLEQVGAGELTFKVGTVDVTISILRPEDEVEVHKYAQGAFENDEDGNHVTLDYLDRLKYASLGFAIVQIGTTSFRGIERVETGEVLKGPDGNEVAVAIPKDQAIRQLVRKKFSRKVLNGIFKKYGEHATRIELENEKLIEFEPADLDTEIEHLQSRIDELKAEKEKEKTEDLSYANLIQQAATGTLIEEEESDGPDSMLQGLVTDLSTEQPNEPVEQPKKSVAALPPQTRATAPPLAERPPVIPQRAAPPPQQQAPQPSRAGQEPERFEDIPSSLVDFSADGSDAAMQAEVDRFYAARHAAQAEGVNEPNVPQGRVPPHLAAQRSADVIEAQNFEGATQVGMIDGKQVYHPGGSPIPLGGPNQPTSPVPVAAPTFNTLQKGNVQNPRFTPPKK